MVKIFYDKEFKKAVKKIKDSSIKEQVKKQIKKIVETPEIGKPMRFARKGTREVYIKPFRIPYAYFDDKILFLAIYHKDKQ